MSESCKPKSFFTLLISDINLFFYLIVSHPLYFSYLVFFSPYLVKLVSFLSPLFLATILLFIAFLTQNRATLLPVTSTSLLESLHFEKNDQNQELHCFDYLGIYEIVFGSTDEHQIEVSNGHQEDDLSIENPVISKCKANQVTQNSVPSAVLENSCAAKEEIRLENFLKILGQFEKMSYNVEEKKKIEPPFGAKANKVVERQETESMAKDGSEAKKVKEAKDESSQIKSQSQRVSFTSFDYTNENLGSYGSMRKEKEWKRTLACKLFEERHNGDGSEGMDSLWEAYEKDSVTIKPKSSQNKSKSKNKKTNTNKKSEVEFLELDGHEEEDEIVGGQLCCLQALKMSAGKMNLGMRKPSLVKISKAIKGFGWLSKNSKKVHNSGDRY